MDELVGHLNGVNELAVDLEHHSYRTYQGMYISTQHMYCNKDVQCKLNDLNCEKI